MTKLICPNNRIKSVIAPTFMSVEYMSNEFQLL